jgi:hypothetical protein
MLQAPHISAASPLRSSESPTSIPLSLEDPAMKGTAAEAARLLLCVIYARYEASPLPPGSTAWGTVTLTVPCLWLIGGLACPSPDPSPSL